MKKRDNCFSIDVKNVWKRLILFVSKTQGSQTVNRSLDNPNTEVKERIDVFFSKDLRLISEKRTIEY